MNSALNIELGDVDTLHETPNDLKKEREAIEVVLKHFGWDSAYKLDPLRFRLDFGCELDAETVALAEVKCRNVRFKQYPDLFLSAAKYRELYTAGRDYGIPTYLCASITDGVYIHEATHPSLFPKFRGGRTDRSNPKDVEFLIGIPWENFIPL